MNIIHAMEHALHGGMPKKPVTTTPQERNSNWRAEFWNPMMAALHGGTPRLPLRSKPTVSEPVVDNSHFFD